MQDITMNELKNSMSGAIPRPVPLFASSWVALFCLLRSSFVKGRSKTETEINDSEDTNANH